MNDAYRSPIICAGQRGIGADFWKRYKGPTERIPEGARCLVEPITRRPVQQTARCVDCGAPFVRYRERMVRCRPCQDRHGNDLRTAAQVARRRATKVAR